MITVYGSHIRAARALLGWSQQELALKAKVALGTVKRIEGFDGPAGARTDTIRKVVFVLEKSGIEFLNDDRPGVRVKQVKR